jgi:uncharacterized protein YndB with AHSA1/START domain
VTDRAALGAWLMENDFEPRIGQRFRFRDPPAPGFRGWIDCEVIELEPPVRMVWSWQRSADEQPTRVEIRLNAVAGGTRLTLEHTGETDPDARSRYTSGWPRKLTALRDQLGLS